MMSMRNRGLRLAGLAFAVGLSLPAAAQDTGKLKAAIEKAHAAPVLTVKGRSEKQERAANPGMTVVMAGGGSQGLPFNGHFEIWKDKEVQTICSAEPIPGFVIYRGKGRDIAQTTFERRPYDLSSLDLDLTTLLDSDKITAALDEADVKSRDDAQTGNRLYLATLPGSLFPKATGPAMHFAPQVLRVEATFTLDAKGQLQSALYEVVRSDPMGSLQQRALSSGGGSITLDGADLEDFEDTTEGARQVYELDYSEQNPSERIEAARKAIETLLGTEHF
ncbi:MAG: hypothetical protein RL885_07795 [Planctomycetota bacterium]